MMRVGINLGMEFSIFIVGVNPKSKENEKALLILINYNKGRIKALVVARSGGFHPHFPSPNPWTIHLLQTLRANST